MYFATTLIQECLPHNVTLKHDYTNKSEKFLSEIKDKPGSRNIDTNADDVKIAGTFSSYFSEREVHFHKYDN